VKQVRIADRAGADGTLRDVTFTDCEIVGPVSLVAVGTGNQVVDCEYPGPVENCAQARWGTGPVVFVVDCDFRRCRFAIDVDASHLQPSGTSESS
jgi:hypothetical protein